MNETIIHLNSVAESWAQFVWSSSWQSVLVAILLMIFVFGARRLPSTVRYAILLVALLKFAAPPFFAAPSGVFSSVTVTNNQPIVAEPEFDRTDFPQPARPAPLDSNVNQYPKPSSTIVIGNGNQSELASKQTPELPTAPTIQNSQDILIHTSPPSESKSLTSQLSIQFWLMSLHAVGSLWFLAMLIRSLLKLNSLKKTSYLPNTQHLIDVFDSTCDRLNFSRKPELRISDSLTSPISFGCLQPIVILPKSIQSNPEFATIAIAHELAHLKRYDSIFNWAQNLLLTIWWFNPVLWVLNGQIRKLREDCCDDLVLLNQIVCEEEYSRSLIEIARISNNQNPAPLQTAFSMAEHPLRDRILRIMNPTLSRSRNISLRGAAAVLVLCAILLPGLKFVMASPKNPIATKSNEPSISGAVVDSETKQEQTEDRQDSASISRRRNSVQFKVLDENKKSIEGASVFASCSGKRPGAKRHDVTRETYATDKDGLVEIKIFEGADLLRTWTSLEGRVTLFTNWEDLTIEDVPTEPFTLQLQPATSIGGIVTDADGNPVENVVVEVRRSEGGNKLDENDRTRLGTWLSNGDDAVRTDAEGKWEINNVPDGDVKVSFQLTHPDYLAATTWQTMARYKITLEQLRQKTATFRLQKGTSITGQLKDPDGNPISDALVIWGDQPYWEDGDQEAVTDAQGNFKTQALPPENTRLTVVAKGWMPESRFVDLSDSTNSTQDFSLKKGKSIRLKFVDVNGNALPGTRISIQKWKNAEALYNIRHPNVKDSKIPILANKEGVYVWDWAPDDPVELSFFNIDLKVSLKKSVTATDQIQTIVLKQPFHLFGKVVNDETDQPIDKFTITPIRYFQESASARGVSQSHQIKVFEASEFDFDNAFLNTDAKSIAYRIDAIGYRKHTTKKYKYDSLSKPVEIRLTPTSTTEVRVVDGENNPAKDVRSWLVIHDGSLMINRFEDYLTDNASLPHSRTNANGVVEFSTPATRYALVAATKSGYAEQYLDADEKPRELKLQPWAQLSGQLFQDGKPVNDATIIVRPFRNLGGDNPHVQDIFQMRTDNDGRFEFKNLPPVPVNVSSVLSAWRDYPISSNKSVPVNLQPGKNHYVNLGGEGLQVVGRVKLVGEHAENIQYRYGINNLVATEATQVKLPEHFSNKLQFQAGEQAEFDRKLWGDDQSYGRITYYVKLNSDGTFLINGVNPGSYRFLIKLYEPPEGCLVDPVGYKFIEFDTSDYEADGNQIDLGELEVKIKPLPKVGDLLSNFRYEDLLGKKHFISQHQGHYLLIDFWATWCEPCVASLPDVKALHEKIREHKEADILSISLDKDPDVVKQLVQDQSLEWNQGIVGEIQSTKAGKALGISSVPLYILLDPQAAIVARTYNFEEARDALLKQIDLN